MKPVLASWPQKKRNQWFGGFLAIIFFVSFLVVALGTQIFFLALLLPPVLAVVGAWALVGWPVFTRPDGKPYVEPHHRPYLFFVVTPLVAILLWFVIGIAATQAKLPQTNLVTLLIILLSIGGGAAVAYLTVGVPNLVKAARERYERIPKDRRPLLFFILAPLFFILFVVILGVVSTQLLDKVARNGPEALLNIQLLVVIPVALALGALVAWLLVGIPKMAKLPAEYLPKVGGKHRLRIFLVTFLLAGIPLTSIVGAILTYSVRLPATIVLGLALVLGYTVSLGLAALVWGTPARWRQFDDYEPGLNPRVRLPLFVGISIGIGVFVVVGIGLADVDIFWGILAGLLAAGVAMLILTGTHRRVAARRGERTLVPDLPDRVKPLFVFPVWFGVALVLFAILTYALPGLVGVNLLISLAVGLALAFFLLEAPLLKDLREERKREREKRKAWETRRKERLAEAEKGNPPGPEA